MLTAFAVRWSIAVLCAAVACGPAVAPSDKDASGDGTGDDLDGSAEDTDTGSAEAGVVEPDLECSRGERVGCLAVEPGEPDLCLCRGQVLEVENPPLYTDWNIGEIRPPTEGPLLAIAGIDSFHDGGYALSTWRSAGDSLELVDAISIDNREENQLVSAILPAFGSAHIVGRADDGSARLRASLPASAHADGLFVVDSSDRPGSALVHVGDFDADGLVDLVVIDHDVPDSENYIVSQQLGNGTSIPRTVFPFPTTVGLTGHHAATTCDLDDDGATDWVHATEGKIAYGSTGGGLAPTALAEIEPNDAARYVRCVDLDLDGRLDLLVTVDSWPEEVYGITALYYQEPDGSFGPPLLTPALASTYRGPPHRGMRAARLFAPNQGATGLDLLAVEDGRLDVLPAAGPRAYGLPRSRELDAELDALGVLDIDGDGRDELIASDYPQIDHEDLVVLWLASRDAP